METLASCFVAFSFVYSVVVLATSLTDSISMISIIKQNLYGLFFGVVTLIAVICALFDGSEQYFAIVLSSAVLAVFGLLHLLFYANNRPRTKEEGRRLAGW